MIKGNDDEANDRIYGLMELAEERLSGPVNHEVFEIAYLAPEAWVPSLVRYVGAHSDAHRLRLLLASLHEVGGEREAALTHARIVEKRGDPEVLREAASRQVERLELMTARQ